MVIIPIICPQCGNNEIDVAPTQIQAKCGYCGTNAAVNWPSNRYVDLAGAAEAHLRHGHFESAMRAFHAITYEFPTDYRGWWGLLRCKTRMFTIFNASDVQEDYRLAMMYASDAEKAHIKAKYEGYITEQNAINAQNQAAHAARQVIENEIDHYFKQKANLEAKLRPKGNYDDQNLAIGCLAALGIIALWAVLAFASYALGFANGAFFAIVFGLVGLLIISFICSTIVKIARKSKVASLNGRIKQLQNKLANMR